MTATFLKLLFKSIRTTRNTKNMQKNSKVICACSTHGNNGRKVHLVNEKLSSVTVYHYLCIITCNGQIHLELHKSENKPECLAFTKQLNMI